MKARAFTVLTTAILICAAALTGTVSGIDNCCFVDRQCQSDRDWIDGFYAFQHNQCLSPAQSQPSSGSPAQIDNCCDVDRQCSTDQQWIDGYWAYQNNQCPVSAQSQPVASSPPAGSAPAQVDNCCDVDRHCTSELQWIAGWHAYQNGLCSAPGQAPAGASSLPASGVLLRTATGIVIGYTGGQSILPSTTPFPYPEPGQSFLSYTYDNCCRYHWQCNNDADWAQGYHAFQTNRHCARPGLLSIVGDPDFVDFYLQRLEELKNRLPHRYNYVLNGLDKIQQDRHREDNGGQASTSERSFHVGWTGPLFDGWEKRRSAAIVHEACHIHRHDAGFVVDICKPETYIREETFCREIELQVIIELGAPSHIIEWAQGMVADTRAGTHVPTPSFC